MNLSTIRITGRTTIKGVNLNFGGTLDPYPYATDLDGNRIHKYMWNEGSGFSKLGRLTNANLSFGMSFKSKEEGKEGDNIEQIVHPDGYIEYYDFDIPWDFHFDYSLSYSKRSPYHDAQVSQSLNFSGRLNLTREWNMSLTTNFDVQAHEFSYTTFNVNLRLHCWNMIFDFVPFGQRKSYSFTINVSSAMLKDLNIDKQRSWFDNQ